LKHHRFAVRPRRREQSLRRVHAAAPLKPVNACTLASPSPRSPPRSRGGSIEAPRSPARNTPAPAPLRRVHAAAPLKLLERDELLEHLLDLSAAFTRRLH